MGSNSHQKGYEGRTGKIFIIIISLLFIAGFIASVWNTHNSLFILGAIGSACIGLLQIPFIHDWVLDAGSFVDQHAGKVMKDIKRGAITVWALRSIILVFIIFGFVLGNFTPIPGKARDLIQDTLCIQNQSPLFFCGNGVSITPMQVDEGQGNQHIMSTMNIGIIDNGNADPFNQYDADNNNTERDLENRIFTENQDCHHPSSVTLIIVTALSQTVADAGLSSSVGLDNLRGAYMAQHNFNQGQQNFCLHLLIANFGTKGVASTTVPILIQQIKLYAESNKQNFLGVVGFPFSISVTSALKARSQIPGDDIPIISPSAVADNFVDPQAAPSSLPDNFYANFYRIVPPVSVESKVMEDFMANYSHGILAPAKNQTVLFEDVHDPYSQSLGSAIFSEGRNFQPEYYTEGQPKTLTDGIDYIIKHQCQPNQQQCNPIQIFFAGYADDLNTLKNKLNAARNQGLLTQPTVRIIGGEGFYDLGSYNLGNYANLFFTMNASYAHINQSFPSDEIPTKFQHCRGQQPYSQPFNCEFSSFFHQVYPTNIYGSELAGMHVLLTYDAVQAFVQALKLDGGAATPSLWQAMSSYWSDVQFQGVSGQIQFSASSKDSVNNPINKPVYVACTDNHGYTHVVAEYNTEHYQPSYMSYSELNKCLNT